MGRYSAGKQWEDLNRRRQIAENQELEAQRAAAYQAVRDQVGGLPCLSSVNATLLADESRRFQDSKSRWHRVEEDMQELEAPETSPPPYRLRAPSIRSFPSSVDGSEKFSLLQQEVVQKENVVRDLESEVKVERDNRRRLQAERYEAIDAQRRAEGEIHKWESRVANLDRLLDGSIKRQKELESELDSSRQEIRELKKQLHEAGCAYDNDDRAREIRERRVTQQQLRDTTGTVIERDRRPSEKVESTPEREARDVPVQSRRQCKSTAGRAFVSIPKHGNRRALWILS